MTTVQVLRKARALIKKGWCQGVMRQYRNGKIVKRCAFDAISEVVPIGSRVYPVMAFERVLPKGISIANWNDSPHRRKAQVLAAFDRAIKACK